MDDKHRVLFLCTANSARSQMAEAFLRRFGGREFEALSAGAAPARAVHPMADEVMREIGIPLDGQSPKPIELFAGRDDIDFVITVCDRARETCPVLPGRPIDAHWSFEDPAAATGSPEEVVRAFRRIRIEIQRRVELFVALPLRQLGREERERRTRAIGSL